jgi:hypothetical protein
MQFSQTKVNSRLSGASQPPDLLRRRRVAESPKTKDKERTREVAATAMAKVPDGTYGRQAHSGFQGIGNFFLKKPVHWADLCAQKILRGRLHLLFTMTCVFYVIFEFSTLKMTLKMHSTHKCPFKLHIQNVSVIDLLPSPAHSQHRLPGPRFGPELLDDRSVPVAAVLALSLSLSFSLFLSLLLSLSKLNLRRSFLNHEHTCIKVEQRLAQLVVERPMHAGI